MLLYPLSINVISDWNAAQILNKMLLQCCYSFMEKALEFIVFCLPQRNSSGIYLPHKGKEA